MPDYREGANAPLVVVGMQVTAIDQQTGRLVWTYSGLQHHAQRCHVTNDRVFVLDNKGSLHCLRLSDGALHGVVPLDGIEATMLPVGDRLYIYAGRKVTALDTNGKIIWQSEVAFDNEWSLVGLAVLGAEMQPDFSRS